MTGTDAIRALARNNAWANATLHAAIRDLPSAAFRADYPSFFGSIPATLNHILLVDRYYFDALAGGRHGVRVADAPAMDDPAELAEAQAAADRALIAFCDSLDPADLDGICRIVRASGVTEERVGATLLHLFQHQIHHRGQVHALLSQAGAVPPQLDDFFLSYGRADSARPYWAEL